MQQTTLPFHPAPKKRKSTSADGAETPEESDAQMKKQRTDQEPSAASSSASPTAVPAPTAVGAPITGTPGVAASASATPDPPPSKPKKRVCHQCRQPHTLYLCCTRIKKNEKRCTLVFCPPCLQRRYDVDYDAILAAGIPSDPAQLEGHDPQGCQYIFSCPACEEKCNCSHHRRSSGLDPLGRTDGPPDEQAIQEALAQAAEDVEYARREVQARKDAERAARIEEKKRQMEAERQAKLEARQAKQQERVQKKMAQTEAQREERLRKQAEARQRLKEAKERQKREARGEYVGEKPPRPPYSAPSAEGSGVGTESVTVASSSPQVAKQMSQEAGSPQEAPPLAAPAPPTIKHPKEPKEPKEPKPATKKAAAGKVQTELSFTTAPAPAAPPANPPPPPAAMQSTLFVPPPKPNVRKPRNCQPPDFEFVAISYPLIVIQGRLRIREFILRFDKHIKLLAKYQRIVNDPNADWTDLTYKNIVQAFLTLLQSDDNPPIHPDKLYESIAAIKKTPADEPALWEQVRDLLDEIIELPPEIMDSPGQTEVQKLDMICWLLELVVGTTAIRQQLDHDLAKEKQNIHAMHDELKQLRAAWEEEKANFNKEKLLLTAENRAEFDARYNAANQAHKKLLLLAEAKCWFENRKLNLRTLPMGTDSMGNNYHMFHMRSLAEEDWGHWVCIEKNPALPHPTGVLPPPPKPTEEDPEPAIDDGEKTWYAVSEPEEILKLAYWIRFKGDEGKYKAEMARWEEEKARARGLAVEVRRMRGPEDTWVDVDYMGLFDRVKKFGECMGVREEFL